jgi:hypothetical protein
MFWRAYHGRSLKQSVLNSYEHRFMLGERNIIIVQEIPGSIAAEAQGVQVAVPLTHADSA